MIRQILLYSLLSLILSACSLDAIHDLFVTPEHIVAPDSEESPTTAPLMTPLPPVEGDSCYGSGWFLPSRGIEVGEQALIVAPGSQESGSVWLREDHSTSLDQELLEPGTTLTILDGPYCFGTRNLRNRWWHVRVNASGAEGYVYEYVNSVGILTVYLNPVAPLNVPLAVRHFSVGIPFSAFGRPAVPSEIVYVSWDVGGADNVIVYRQDTGEVIGTGDHNVLTFEVPEATTEVTFVLVATAPDGTQMEQVRTLEIDCPDCQSVQSSTLELSYQPFEGGFMVYRTDIRQIYLFFSDGTLQIHADAWAGEGIDVGESPPADRYQPQFGFGWVWANQPGVRDRLGWATNAETYYTSILMTTQSADGLSIVELQIADGRHVVITAGTWRFCD